MTRQLPTMNGSNGGVMGGDNVFQDRQVWIHGLVR